MLCYVSAAFYRAYQRSETFRETFEPLVTVLQKFGSLLFGAVGSAVTFLADKLGGFGGVIDVVLASVAALGVGLVKSVVAPFKLIFSQIKALQLALTGNLPAALTTSLEGFKEFGTGAAKAFVGTFNETMTAEVKTFQATNKIFEDPFGLVGKKIELPIGIAAPSSVEAPKVADIPTSNKSAEFLKKVQDQYDALIEKSKLYGKSFDVATAKRDLFANSIDQALSKGFGPSSTVVESLYDRFLDLRDSIEGVTAPIDNKLDESLGLNAFVLQASLGKRASNEFKEAINGLQVNPAVAQSFNDLGTAFEAINIKQSEFGAGFDGLAAKMTLVKDLISETVENGFNAYGASIEELLLQQEGLTAQQDNLTASLQRQAAVLDQIGQVASTAFDAVTSAMSQGASAAQAFGRATVGAIREAIAAEIKLAVVAQARQVLSKVPFPFNIAAATIAGAGASALFNGLLNSVGIPALAKGGFVDQPTLALIGEAGPEVVVPLDRLREFQNNNGGGGNMNVTGRLVAAGSDLIAVFDRARSDEYVTA